ncbi:MAG: hypothetical protein ACRENI_00510, partial [Gemmatimonadaceae bacterium]
MRPQSTRTRLSLAFALLTTLATMGCAGARATPADDRSDPGDGSATSIDHPASDVTAFVGVSVIPM